MNKLMILLSLLTLILGIISIKCSNIDVNVELKGKLVIPDNASAANIIISLNGQEYETITKVDGSFIFPSIPPGIYLLDVLSVKYTFPQMKIRITDKDIDSNNIKSKVTVIEYKYPGAKKIPYNNEYLILTALYPNEYFQVHPPFSIIGWITGNPMMLMMLGSLVIVLYFPTILEGIDPEVLKEYQKDLQNKDEKNIDEDKMVED